jgi:hypothetical protein
MLAHIAPSNLIKEHFTDNVIAATWESLRYQRAQTAMINIAYRQSRSRNFRRTNPML